MENSKPKRLNSQELKVAIVCDWLTDIGGAERVVLELHHLFPDAPIYTSQYDPAKLTWFINADVRTTWLQKLPKKIRKFMPILRAFSFSKLDLTQYDLVISSSGAEAKGIIKLNKSALHICYCHSPTHYYWSRYAEYLKNPGFGKLDPVARLGLKLLAKPMRMWDYRAAQKPDVIIANSNHIKERIADYYRRDSVIVHPPVDIARFKHVPKPKLRQGFVVTGRQTPYKKINLAVAACTHLDLPLTVIGNGPDHEALRKLAGPSIKFITDASDEDVVCELSKAKAFIFPGLDDFGIAPVEAMAAGTPVIAYRGGGALDYVIPNKTGVFFNEQSVDSLCDAISSFNSNAFSENDIKKQAERFSVPVFQKNMLKVIEDSLKKHPASK